jgi:hypothetical protein
MSRRTLVVLLVLSLVVVTWGCRSTKTSSGATTGGTSYIVGTYQKSYPWTVTQAVSQAETVLHADSIPVYKRQVGATVATLEGTLSDGSNLKMDFKATSASNTTVTIRVGTFGDSSRTNYFFSKLDERMGERPGTAVGKTTSSAPARAGAAETHTGETTNP